MSLTHILIPLKVPHWGDVPSINSGAHFSYPKIIEGKRSFTGGSPHSAGVIWPALNSPEFKNVPSVQGFRYYTRKNRSSCS